MSGTCEQEGCGIKVSVNVEEFSKQNYNGKVLCMAHQKKYERAIPDPQNKDPGLDESDPEFQAANKVKSPGKTKSGEKWQEDIVNFETLLSDAHKLVQEKQWVMHINTVIEKELTDMKEKRAVVHATVTFETLRGECRGIFQGTGDADQTNCGDFIRPHFMRMAESRAICRALRWATNNAQCSEEEKK